MNMSPSILPSGLMVFVMVAFWAATFIVHVCFAAAVLADANRLPNSRSPIFVGPPIWFLATLFGGIFIAAIYWVMHHSRLNVTVSVTSAES